MRSVVLQGSARRAAYLALVGLGHVVFFGSCQPIHAASVPNEARNFSEEHALSFRRYRTVGGVARQRECFLKSGSVHVHHFTALPRVTAPSISSLPQPASQAARTAISIASSRRCAP